MQCCEEYKENIEPYSNQDNYLTSIFFKKQGSVYLPVVPFTPEHISNAYKSINVDKDELEETSNNKENKESSSPDEVDEITSTISKEGKLFKLLKTATMDSSKDDKEEENDDEEDDLEKGEDDEEEEEGEEDIEEDMGRGYRNKNECLKFSYRGCDKNANNFETMRDCEIKCIISKKGSKSSREK
ncbi:unnamed protein product [Lepeophtheirus salmonis]|uniref:(salmon louse) hypothetical protein n=1 Tax=Lepeophtheirus salmonis TaxID=72036 RepID=A0A7R8H821_LEPSM|nr:unnamed protein product [Lepeophtheirus salmonis]CAF2921712.1 unnamed protein product [Lepeophtheirus salmonis]